MRAFMQPRYGTIGVVFGLIAVLCVGVGLLAFALAGYAETNRLQHALITSCQNTDTNNEAAKVDLRERMRLYDRIMAIERVNPFIDDVVRAERMDAYRDARVAAEQRLAKIKPPRDCMKLYG